MGLKDMSIQDFHMLLMFSLYFCMEYLKFLNIFQVFTIGSSNFLFFQVLISFFMYRKLIFLLVVV
jgi:hypothetical protein